MSVRHIEDIYPLSPMQQGMLFHSLYAPESGVYFEQSSWTLRGNLDALAFERAWQRVVDRHSALRTAFLWEDVDEPLQVVHRQAALPLEKQDWRGLSGAEQEARLEALLLTDRARGFELSEASLMRLTLVRLAEDAYHFVWSHHHLLLDGWSQPLIFHEVLAFYAAFQQGQDVSLAPSRSYRDYIAWLQQQNVAEAEAFWRRTLKGFTAPTPLTVDRTIEGKEGYALQRALLPVETTAALQALARQHQLTLNTIVQGAWALLLSRYSGEEDVVFGATVSGRPADLPGAEAMVGLFINTLPVRVLVRPNALTLSWLKELQVQQAELRQYEYSPLVEIQGWSEAPRDQSLFESLLVFENYPVDDAVSAQETGFKIERGRSFTRTNYPLTVAVSPGREMGLEVACDCCRFDADTMGRLLGHLQTLLQGMAADPEQRLAALPLLTGAERQQLLVEWNTTQTAYPTDRCAHEWFEAQAAQTPTATAVVFERERLTYAALNRQANRVAHYLRRLGVGPETLVGLCVERSLALVVGLLGVLKAGGAYAPLDPDYPAERLAFMLADTQAPLLLTQAHLVERLPAREARTGPEPGRRVVLLDADWDEIGRESDENPVSGATADNLAYVIYTSGSTGRPKGTLLRHRGLCNFVQSFIPALALDSDSRVLQFASFGFDASVGEVFAALLSGATLYLARRETLLSLPDLMGLLREAGITAATLPPAMLRLLPPEELPALRAVASVGEACGPDIVARWASGRRLLNGYGPTETSIGTVWGQIESLSDGATHVPIGRVIANAQAYILDRQGQPVPVGVPGELHIGGVGLGRGYLNRPDLTAERFVLHPFSSEVGERLYKTGDLARYLADGNIEFVGRVDQQVKVRGYRIELGEVEAVLSGHPAVQQAVVVAREDGAGEKVLAAYVVLAGAGEAKVGELRGYLRERLPGYMVPAAFVELAALPLTASGKVDRRALPAPDGARPGPAETFVAPRTLVEEGLAEVWAQVLGLERVGVRDNFFDLGGHSLLATRLISQARQVFQVELLLRDLFESPTVAGQAERLEATLRAASGLETPPIEPVSRGEALPLSFAQQRLWFLDQLEPGNLFYNIPLAVRLKGHLDEAALERSLNQIVRRHEVLRTTFATVEGRPVQVIAPEWDVPLPVEDLTDWSEAERPAIARRLAEAEARQPFDLARGPLLRARLLRLGEAEHVVLLTMHHIVSDGWSMGVFVQEVAAFYAAFSTGKPSPLPELPVQYADFAHWQRRRLQGEALQNQLAYWQEQLDSSPSTLELPTDRPRPAVQTSRGATLSFALPQDLSRSFKTLGREENATLFMTLLAAFQTLLGRYTGQEDVSVGTPIANRTRAEIEGLIGFFVNTLVLRTDLSGGPGFRELLGRVREVALGAYAHQDLPFEMLVEALRPERALSHTPLFQVMLVLDTPPTGAFQLPGLTLSAIETHSGAATFDLTLSVVDGPDRLGGYVEYNTDLFDRATVERLIGHLQTLLTGIVADPDQPISTLSLLTGAERQQLLTDWNATAVAFPRNECIHHLFEAQAAVRPTAVAVTFEGQRLSYDALNRRANQLAHYLRRLGVGREVLVGISTGRAPEMVVGILGVLKAGGAYLPLDPTYPAERLAFMLEDSQAPVLLTQAHLVERLPAPGRRVVRLDADWDAIARESEENPLRSATADDLAYVIYTSGSTGRPKGTMLRHRGLCNLADAQQRAFGVKEGSRVLQFSPLSFDASVWETFMALRNGATLCLARQEVLASGTELVRLLREEEVTNVTLPPSVLRLLPEGELPALRTVIAAGEACTPDLVARWAEGRDFYNAYGPTETTVCASMYRCQAGEASPPPIGRPIGNTELYVLDRNMQLLPVGVGGELHVGGVGLARGYLRRPEMTEARFVAHPFSDDPAARLYKTGDLVRYRADGNLEFLGRIDQQVKVRGYRIELGEVEAVLGQHPGVREAVVAAREEAAGDKRLVGYVVAAGELAPTVGELRGYLRQRLPEYMAPSVFVYLERLPLSPSGKVERRALPAPEGQRPELEGEYVAPRDEVESELAAMCGELLGVDRVGVYDSFFELGGHSLLATQFISRVREVFGVELPLRTLFEHPMVAEIAPEVERAKESGVAPQAPAIAPIPRDRRRVKRSALDP